MAAEHPLLDDPRRIRQHLQETVGQLYAYGMGSLSRPAPKRRRWVRSPEHQENGPTFTDLTQRAAVSPL